MAFHYGGGAMSMAAISIANPRNAWIDPDTEETPTGKQVLKKAAAGIKKSGMEIARAPSRLGSLRRRSTTLDGETRPASRLSSFMEKLSVGNNKEEGESPRRSRAPSDVQEKNTPNRSLRSVYASFRKHRSSNRAATAPICLRSPEDIPQSDETASTASTTKAGSVDGYSLCRVSAAKQFPERISSRVVPSLPLPSFPSMIAMPPRAPSVAESYCSGDRDEYSGEEDDEQEAKAVGIVSGARLITVGNFF
ncbi:hypothetical protein Slin15195_G001450 [Septoria linicola]|uniref:Uncharacterized protein n=1 Tax=Septoria linicola TaxID=215465 RepID=A0A9Q9AL54_9PEZI|nr:hypothetical protein Slin14017_G001480 [Septoria linicola]USW46826.1 hypothetical protein Slin15195_G001450 [Septoria linicola]